MRKIVVAIAGILVLTGGGVSAQESSKAKKDAPKGHESMAAGAGLTDAATILKAVSAAPPEIGKNATVMGIGPDGKMKQLRAGTNGWMCMVDPAGDPMCLDKEWQVWADAWVNKKDPPQPKAVGIAYMLRGDKGAIPTPTRPRRPRTTTGW